MILKNKRLRLIREIKNSDGNPYSSESLIKGVKKSDLPEEVQKQYNNHILTKSIINYPIGSFDTYLLNEAQQLIRNDPKQKEDISIAIKNRIL